MSKNKTKLPWPDWSDFMKTGKAQTEHPLSKALNSEPNKGGEKVTKEQLLKEAMDIVKTARTGAGRQPTDQELFGHLVVTEEQLKKMEEEWQNRIINSLKDARKPIQKPDDLKEWANGKSFNDSLTEEELAKRNMHIDSNDKIEGE